jgi:hypothetical protein
MAVGLVEAFFILLGLAFWFGTVFGLYNYVQLARYPVTSPQAVTEGDTVSIWGTVTDDSDLVRAPFSRDPVAAVYWDITDHEAVPDGSGSFRPVASGVAHGESLVLEHDGGTFPVELPAEMGSVAFQDTPMETVETVAAEGDPLPHIEVFEAERDIDGPSYLSTEISSRSYREGRLDVGDEVLVSGAVRPGGGEVVPGSRFTLSGVDARFRIMTESRKTIKRKRLLASAATFVLGCLWIGVGVFFVG